MNDNNWKKQNYSSYGHEHYEVERVLYIDDIENPKYKFMEEIKFSAKLNEQESDYAICIGLNPAKAEKDLDETNKRLISLLRKEYSGYYLFNIFPEITENATQIDLEDKENICFVEKLKNILEEAEYKALDVVLFFGRTLIIPNEFLKLLRQWIRGKKNIYITVHNGEFTHPSSNAKIEKMKLKSEYFRKNTCIRVLEKKR